jgi:hypothetical protein
MNIEPSYTKNAILEKLNPRSRHLPGKPNVAQIIKKFLTFYETEFSLPCLQEPGIGPYYEPNETNQPHPTEFLKIHLIRKH